MPIIIGTVLSNQTSRNKGYSPEQDPLFSARNIINARIEHEIEELFKPPILSGRTITIPLKKYKELVNKSKIPKIINKSTKKISNEHKKACIQKYLDTKESLIQNIQARKKDIIILKGEIESLKIKKHYREVQASSNRFMEEQWDGYWTFSPLKKIKNLWKNLWKK